MPIHSALPRRRFLALTAGVLASLPAVGHAEPAEGLATALDHAYRAGVLHGLHALHIVQNGDLVLEDYFKGRDEIWGRAVGEVTFGADTLHDLRSVSKSVTSLLYGIALDRGLVPGPDTPLLNAFPEHAALGTDKTRAGWTIAHALNMTLGIDWNEALPYTDPNNSEIQMERADDRIAFILSRPVVSPPGAAWNYNGGCTALIGEIVERGTGRPLQDFAKEALFEPLGIANTHWTPGSDGRAAAASGLRMTAPDLSRIGQMILAGGQWNGRQILSAAWLTRCMTPQTQTVFGSMYSHFWYLSRQFPVGASKPIRMMHAAGNGGQRLYVLPGQNLVVTIFAGAYNQPNDWMTPTLILQRIVLPHLVG